MLKTGNAFQKFKSSSLCPKKNRSFLNKSPVFEKNKLLKFDVSC